MSDELQWWTILVMGFGPLAIMVLSGLLGGWLIARTRRKLEEACAAVPPRLPGEPARCHVCGGPLSPLPGDVVASCGFCHADNVVTKSVLDRMAHRTVHQFDSYETLVAREAKALGARSTTAVMLSLSAVVLAPVVCFAVFFVALVALTFQEKPLNDIEYVVRDLGGTSCVAELTAASDGRRVLYFGKKLPMELGPTSVSAADVGPESVLRAPALVGKTIHTEWGSGVISRVYGSALTIGENTAAVTVAGMEHTLVDLTGACFAKADTPVSTFPRVGRSDALFADPEGTDLVAVGERESYFLDPNNGIHKPVMHPLGSLAAPSPGGVTVIGGWTLHRVTRAGARSVFSLPQGSRVVAMARQSEQLVLATSDQFLIFNDTKGLRDFEIPGLLQLHADDNGIYAARSDEVLEISAAGVAHSLTSLQVDPGTLTGDRAALYFVSEGKIVRLDRVSRELATVTRVTSPIRTLFAHQGYVYWARRPSSERPVSGVFRVPSAGGAQECVTSVPEEVVSFARLGAHVYWLDAKKSRVGGHRVTADPRPLP